MKIIKGEHFLMSCFDKDVIEFAQDLEKKIEYFSYREHKSSKDQQRDEYQRDYGRVLYSSSFRRLQGKMQLLGVDSTDFYRNRLTHSLEVAQIARSIAFNLNLVHPVVAETCSLAHDLGNPPFGHAGERVLNELAEEVGGYEGNAQTFRILRYLEKKHSDYPGLDLTLRTLFGVTKYFFKRTDNAKKFLYDEDYYFLKQEIANKKLPDIQKSIDAQIMDLADEIAYAAHDLEDAISSGFITLSEMMYEFKIHEKFKDASDIFNTIATEARDVAWQANRLDTSEEYSFILRKKITSNIVHKLINDVGIVKSDNGFQELGYKSFSKLAEGLKKLVFKALLRKNHIQLYEKQGERIIRGLFEVYTDSRFNKNSSLLPPELRSIIRKSQEENQNKIKKRIVIDYISGMMDSFAMKEYKKYFGASSLDLVYDKNIWNDNKAQD